MAVKCSRDGGDGVLVGLSLYQTRCLPNIVFLFLMVLFHLSTFIFNACLLYHYTYQSW